MTREMTKSDFMAAQLPPSQASTLPPPCYTSREFYEREVEHIFLKEWLCVGRVDQVEKPGDFFTLTLLGERLIVVRDEENQVRVLSNVCRHRATKVVEGRGNRRTFECPYHGWTYSLKGELIGAPEMQRTDNFDKKQCQLASPRVETWEGFIFVNFDQRAQPLGPKLAPLSERLQHYNLSEMRTVKTLVYEGNWNWKIMVENYMEAYHVLGLHKGPHDVMPVHSVHNASPQAYNITNAAYNGAFGIIWGDFATPGATFYSPGVTEAEPGKTEWLPSPFPLIESLSPEERQRGDFINIYPTHLFTPLPDGMFYGQILPQAADRITWSLALCFPPAAMEMPDFEQHLEHAVEGLEFINKQDMWACESVQQGLNSRMARPGRYCHLEECIHQLAQYVMDRVLDKSHLAH